MLTAKRSFFLFFCAAAFTLLALAEDTPIQSFQLGNQIELSLKKNDFIYYKFRVDEINPAYDLSIVARPHGDNDPELFLSTTEQRPNSKDTSELFSTSVGYSSIYIPSAEIKANTDYHLGVGCFSEVCDFMISVDYAQEYYMRDHVEDVIIDYVHGGTVVIRLTVPNRTSIDHILLSAEVEAQAETDQSVKMYVNKGNVIPTSSKSDVIALDAWRDGKAANIFRGDPNFCVECNYTIVIEAVKKSKVIFRRTFYGEQIPLELNAERNDAVEYGAWVTYAVNVSKFDVDTSFILVEVTPYFGRTKVLANLETLPAKLEDYKFSLTGYGQELLFIPVQVKPSNNLLYVTVNGTSFSTYTIKVYTTNKKNMVLKLGEPEVGYILEKDVDSFLLASSGRKNMKMTFSLHPEQGKVSLFVKTCKEKNKCSFAKEEVAGLLDGSISTSIKTPIVQFANTTGDKHIDIEMDGSTCESSGSAGTPTCYFAVAVLGEAEGTSKFMLTATRADLPQALRVSRPVKEHLSVDQYRYYYFTVGNDLNVESVNFQITKISGSVDIFISRKSKYPDARDKEEFHHYNDFYSFERANFPILNGTYYIAIKAFTSATFSIVPIVKYNTEAENLGGHHLVKLLEGVPQKTVLDNGEPAYFKFEAFISNEQSHGLEITLDEIQGHFIICAGTNTELPTLERCQFQSNNGTLIINRGDAGFDPLGTYIVGVFPKSLRQEEDEDGNPILQKKPKVQSFSITWAALHTFRTVSFGLPLMNWVNSQRTLYYKIELHPGEDKEIVIHKATTTATSSSQVTLYLANVETKLGHNVTAFNPDMTLGATDTLKLKEADIDKLCEDNEKCYLYLAVATASTDDISFTLTITKDFDDLRISESIEATYSFPSAGHPLHLYYYPHHLEDIIILAHTFGRNITLYANVINTRDHSSRSTWNFPSNRTHEFVARNSMSHVGESRLHIPAAELSSCGADYDRFRCGIALTLIYGEPDQTQLGGIYKEFGLFSILANQEITPIAAGKPIHTSVGEGAYSYFSLFVNKDQATLMISANVLSGQHVVVLASKGKDARPTLSTAEFRTYSGKMESLQVSGEETLQGTARGYWVIAVYGHSQTEFVLNVIYENAKMIELHRGLPVNVDVNKDAVFFEYYHETDSSFEFKIAKERGAGKISIKYYQENETATDNLPTEHSGSILKNFDNFQNVILVSNRSQHFCKGCLYIVGIFPHTAMKVSLVTQIPGQFIFLQDNMIFTDSASSTTQNMYEHIARIYDVIDINFVVYSGEPHIYVSHNPTVNATNYLWSYTQVSSNNYIRMRLDNSEYLKNPIVPPVFDGAHNVSSYRNIYYIMVTAPIDANYSIAVSVSNSTRSLVDGHLDFGFLNPGEFNLYKYHVSKDNIDSVTQNSLKLQFTLHKDNFFTALEEELTRPNIVVMSVPHNSYNNASINKQTMMPDLPILSPIRDDELERSVGDQHYTLNLLYQAPADQDFYIIVNNTESTRHLNYSLVANSHEPVFLTLNNFHASRLSVGDSEIYAVHAGHPGLLVIEIHECVGQVVVQTSNSRNFIPEPIEAGGDDVSNNPSGDDAQPVDDETFNGQSSQGTKTGSQFHELSASSMGSQIKLASIDIEQEQTIYILIRGFDGVRDDDNIQDPQAVYKIRVGLHPLRNFMPFKSLQPGYDGVLTWEVPSQGKLKLSFGEVKNLALANKAVKSTKFGNLDIQYHYEAIFTKRPEMGSYLAKCDMLPKQQGIFKAMDMYQKSVTFDESSLTDNPDYENAKTVLLDTDDIPEQYVTLKVTAVGVDSNGNAVWDYPIIYKTTGVKTETKILGVGSSTFLIVLLVVCMVMLVAAIGGMYYYYNKFQRVKAKLNYEMTDLRNIANTVESFDTLDEDRDKSGYTGLIGKE